MGEKQQLLRDATAKPTEELISAGLGEATILYEEFIKNIKSQGITLMDWRFYNDGKAWLSKGEYKRLGQKCLTPRNKKKFTKIAFQIFVNFGLFPKELLLLPPFTRF